MAINDLFEGNEGMLVELKHETHSDFRPAVYVGRDAKREETYVFAWRMTKELVEKSAGLGLVPENGIGTARAILRDDSSIDLSGEIPKVTYLGNWFPGAHIRGEVEVGGKKQEYTDAYLEPLLQAHGL